MSKLISEPPLLVLPSLACEVGLSAGILLQQLHFAAGQRAEDGWVTRSAGDWSRSLRKVLAPRTVERAFAKLLESGWVEAMSTPGCPTSYRVTPAREAGVGSASEAEGGPPPRRGSVSREGSREKASSESPSEMPEFGEWIGYHAEITGSSVLRAGTKARKHIAGMYAARRAEGYSHPDLKLAVVGAFNDEFRRQGGHFGHESCLRPLKIAELVEKGRRFEAARGSGTDWSRFDD